MDDLSSNTSKTYLIKVKTSSIHLKLKYNIFHEKNMLRTMHIIIHSFNGLNNQIGVCFPEYFEILIIIHKII